MTIAFGSVSSVATAVQATTSITFPLTCSGGNRLATVGILNRWFAGWPPYPGHIGFGPDNVASVTYGGVAMNRVHNLVQLGWGGESFTSYRLYLYDLIGAPSGSNNVVVTLTGQFSSHPNSVANAGTTVAWAASYSGVATRDATTTFSSNFDWNNIACATTVKDKSWLIGAVLNTAVTYNPQSGTVVRLFDGPTGFGGGIADKGPVSPPGSVCIQGFQVAWYGGALYSPMITCAAVYGPPAAGTSGFFLRFL